MARSAHAQGDSNDLAVARNYLLIPSLAQGLYLYRSHPTRDLTSATTARIAAWLYGRWLLSGAYRFSYFAPVQLTAAAIAAGAQNPVTWRQHDGYVTMGYAALRFGATLHYGVLAGSLAATPDYAETSHHIGATARFSPWGDGLLSLTASIYPTETLFRGELGWSLPITERLRARPAMALQWSGGALRPNGSLTVSYDHPRFSIFVGGKYGVELRPAYLSVEVVYNGPERIPMGVWSGITVRPSLRARLGLSLSYALDRLLRDTTDATTGAVTVIDSQAHYLTLGVSKEI